MTVKPAIPSSASAEPPLGLEAEAGPIRSPRSPRRHERTRGAKPSKPPGARAWTEPGLYLVSTPIGNAQDITLRALDVLEEATVIACEDTRVTRKLMAIHRISTPLTPYHDHNARRVQPELIGRLKNGETVALVSDAGTPLISDPGYLLVRAAIGEGIPVTPIPGPSAMLAALVVSGLPTDRFLFVGFLPARARARRRALGELLDVKASLVFLEAPRRLAEALTDMAASLGTREAAVTRELTKKFEEVRRGTLAELAEHYRHAGPPKGEVTVVVAPPGGSAPPDEDEVERLLRAALERASLRDAVAEVAALTRLPRQGLYARALAIKGGEP